MKSLDFAVLMIAVFAVVRCGDPEPLTPALAASIVEAQVPPREPVYAEVPQRVWFGPKSPKDDYDEKAIRTLGKLEAAGLVTVTQTNDADGMTTYQAKVTEKGFRLLGTMPSKRGPVYRAKICERVFDGVRNFVRHPTDPTVGRAELMFHYDNPTPMYAYFDTKINKPLKTPFYSLVSFYFDNGQYLARITVRSIDAGAGGN